MTTALKPGSRWKSAVCDSEFVIVRPPKTQATLACGGATVLAHGAARPAGLAPEAGLDGGSLLGKRYADEESGIEVLCTKPGAGSLSVDGRLAILKEAKKLPSSD